MMEGLVRLTDREYRTRLLGAFTADHGRADRLEHEFLSRGRRVVRRQTPRGELIVATAGTAGLPVHLHDQAGDGLVVVDGEFYSTAGLENHAEHVWQRYGAAGTPGLAQLDGGAAVTLWDPATTSLKLFRDPDGAVPLFHTTIDDALYWSSDLAPLIDLLPSRAINRTALDFFLAEGYVAAPLTLVDGIQRLTAGELLTATAPGSYSIEVYAHLSGQPKARASKEEQARQYGRAFTHAMERRYEPNRSTAVLLSGGVDSTLMTGVLAKMLGAPVQTFTFQYLDYDGPKNEGGEARAAAEYFGVPHELIPVSARDVMDRAPALIKQYEEPFTFGLHSFKLDALANAGVEVVFSGQGSGQYQSRREWMQFRYAAFPGPLRAAIRRGAPLASMVSSRLGERVNGVMVDAPASAERAYREEITPAAVRAGLYLDGDIAQYRSVGLDLHRRMLDRHHEQAPRDQLIFTSERMKADHMALWNHRWSRAHGLAMRQPYRDPELLAVLFHARNPEHGKLAQRRFAETLMPHEIAHAPKLHQHVPVIEWLREGGPLVPYVRDQLSESRVRASGLFDPDAVSRLIDSHIAGENRAWAIWGLVLTLLWQEHVLKRD